MRYIFAPNEQRGTAVKTHAVHGSLADAILKEYIVNGERLADDRAIWKAAEAVTEFGIEIGAGPCFMDRPWEVFQIDGLALAVPSGELEQLYQEWIRSERRLVPAPTELDPGRHLPYFKLKGSHCLVIPPALYVDLMTQVDQRIPTATAAEREFTSTRQSAAEIAAEANAAMRKHPAPLPPAFAAFQRRPKPRPQG